jgi:hypothetical protein
MPIVKAESKSGQDPVPAGVHHAVCYAVIDIGTQDPNNPTFRPSRKTIIIWELPHETITTPDGPKPRVISCEYTCSIGKKATLRSVLESWRGRPFTAEELNGFDLKKIIGHNCQLNIVHKPGKADPSRIYARIQSVVPLVKGMSPLKPANEVIYYDIPDAGPINIPPTIPEWIAAKIIASDEYKERNAGVHTEATQVAPEGGDDKDVPF